MNGLPRIATIAKPLGRQSAWIALLIVGWSTVAGCHQPQQMPISIQNQSTQSGETEPRHFLTIRGTVMVAGAAATTAVIYLIDEDRDLLSALAYDQGSKRLVHLQSPIALDRALRQGASKTARLHARITGEATGQKYTAMILPLGPGDDALLVMDHTGVIAAFRYDPAARSLTIFDLQPILDMFK
jgi:hypothetical protein